MTITYQLQYQSRNLIQALKSWTMPAWVDAYATRLGVVAIAVLLSVGYIFQTSSAAVNGYRLNALETQVSQLTNEIQKIETESISYSSIKSIEERAARTDMVSVGKISHIAPVETVVAYR